MSTLSAARADNFYYPPNWDPSKESLSQHTGDTKGRNQYEQKGLIRFELPFDGWCTACGRHVGKGVRFNAKKDADGKYHSTTIWKFTTRCPSCTATFVVKTDPARSDYVFSGDLRRKVESYGEDAALGYRQLTDTDHREKEKALKRRADPIARLERGNDDRAAARKAAGELYEDYERAARHEDSSGVNALLRKRHRAVRETAAAADATARSLGLAVPLLPHDPRDAATARAVAFRRPTRAARAAKSAGIFGDAPRAKAARARAADRGITGIALRPERAPRRAPTPAPNAKRRRR